MKQKSIRILVTDDHKLFRRALTNLIQTFNFQTVLSEASNGLEALDIISKNKIDVLLLDVQMPVLNGIETMKRIKNLEQKPHVLILTQFDDQALITNMLRLGANGFLLKDCDPEELNRAILSVMDVGYFINDLISSVIQATMTNRQNLPSIEISTRELEIMVLLKEGNSSKQISGILNLSVYTVESYRKALMKKTNCKNVADIVSLAYRTGIVS